MHREMPATILIHLVSALLGGGAGTQRSTFFWTDEIVWKKYIEEREREKKKRFTCQQPTSHILLWSSKYEYKYKLSNGKIHVNLGGPHSSEAELDPSIASVGASSGGGEGENRGVELLSMALVTRVPGWRDKDPCPGDRGLMWPSFLTTPLWGLWLSPALAFPWRFQWASPSLLIDLFTLSVCARLQWPLSGVGCLLPACRLWGLNSSARPACKWGYPLSHLASPPFHLIYSFILLASNIFFS